MINNIFRGSFKKQGEFILSTPLCGMYALEGEFCSKSINFCRMLFILPLLLFSYIQFSYSQAVGYSGLELNKTVPYYDFFTDIDDFFANELAGHVNTDYRRVKVLNSDLRSSLRNLNGIEEVSDLDYCVAWTVDRYFEKTEPNFYDNLIIENSVFLEGMIYIYSIRHNSIADSKKIYFNKLSRDTHDNLKEEILKEAVILFRNFIRQLDSRLNVLSVVDRKVFFAEFDRGMDSGVRRGNYLRTADGGLAMITMVKDDAAFGYIIIPPKNENDVYYRLIKNDFDFKIKGGAYFHRDSNENVLFSPELNFSLFIPVIQYFKPFIDSTFLFIMSEGDLFVPIFLSTGVELYFDLYFIRFYHNAGIGALFSPNTDRVIRSDSFFLHTFGGISGRITSDISIFTDFGYRFVVSDNFFKDWGISLSGFSLKAGIGIVF